MQPKPPPSSRLLLHLLLLSLLLRFYVVLFLKFESLLRLVIEHLLELRQDGVEVVAVRLHRGKHLSNRALHEHAPEQAECLALRIKRSQGLDHKVVLITLNLKDRQATGVKGQSSRFKGGTSGHESLPNTAGNSNHEIEK